MKTSLMAFALLLSVSVQAHESPSGAICWNGDDGEIDCSVTVEWDRQTLGINDVYRCATESPSACYQVLIQHAEDCVDKGVTSIDECVIW